jgi:hypothetical protein
VHEGASQTTSTKASTPARPPRPLNAQESCMKAAWRPNLLRRNGFLRWREAGTLAKGQSARGVPISGIDDGRRVRSDPSWFNNPGWLGQDELSLRMWRVSNLPGVHRSFRFG